MSKKSNILAVLLVLLLIVAIASLIFVYRGLIFGGDSEEKESGSSLEVNLIDDIMPLSVLQPEECPFDSGEDTDEDGIIDECDNCILHSNYAQQDEDVDGIGDICDYEDEDDNNSGFSSDDDDNDDGEDDEDNETCEDECSDGAMACIGNGTRTCHDYDGDGCTEWSSVAECSYNEMCTEGFCI